MFEMKMTEKFHIQRQIINEESWILPPNRWPINNAFTKKFQFPPFFICRNVFITYIDPTISYDVMVGEMREICGFPRVHPFTIKWVDEEGDPCTISSQLELSEAIRLYEANKEAELTVHGRNRIFLYVFFSPRKMRCSDVHQDGAIATT